MTSNQNYYDKAVELYNDNEVMVIDLSVEKVHGGAWVSAVVWVDDDELEDFPDDV